MHGVEVQTSMSSAVPSFLRRRLPKMMHSVMPCRRLVVWLSSDMLAFLSLLLM